MRLYPLLRMIFTALLAKVRGAAPTSRGDTRFGVSLHLVRSVDPILRRGWFLASPLMVAATALLFTVASERGRSLPAGNEEILRRLRASIVRIDTGIGFGTGVIVGRRIVTAGHVLWGTEILGIERGDGRKVDLSRAAVFMPRPHPSGGDLAVIELPEDLGSDVSLTLQHADLESPERFLESG